MTKWIILNFHVSRTVESSESSWDQSWGSWYSSKPSFFLYHSETWTEGPWLGLYIILWRALNLYLTHTHTCMHTYTYHIHTPLTLGIWSSELAQQSATLDISPHSITIQAPRKHFCISLALCPGKPHQTAWTWCAEHLQECQRQTSPQKAEGSEQKCLGKRKGKLINLSNPSSQLECSRFLYNKLLFLSSAKHSFSCFSSCSSSWFWR